MIKGTRKKILIHSSVLAGLITAGVFFQYLSINFNGLYTLKPVFRTLSWIFPHELFVELNILLFTVFDDPTPGSFPFISVAFILYLLSGIILFRRNPTESRFITGSCWVLIISLLIALPMTFVYHFRLLEAYNNYIPPAPGKENQLLNLMNDFNRPTKPSVLLTILHVIILLLYVFEAFYIIQLVRRFKRHRQMHRS